MEGACVITVDSNINRAEDIDTVGIGAVLDIKDIMKFIDFFGFLLEQRRFKLCNFLLRYQNLRFLRNNGDGKGGRVDEDFLAI